MSKLKFSMRDLADHRHGKHAKPMRVICAAMNKVAWQTDAALWDQVRRLRLGKFSRKTIKAAEKAFEDFGLALEWSTLKTLGDMSGDMCEAFAVEYRDAPESLHDAIAVVGVDSLKESP